jgi:acetone carboxylase gamma subunit
MDWQDLDKLDKEYKDKFRNGKYVRFGFDKVSLDDGFTLEELEFIVELMKKNNIQEAKT